MAIVINKRTATHTFPNTLDPKNPRGGTELLILHPGANDLQGDQEKLWEKVRKHPDAVEMLEAKELIVCVDSDGKEIKNHLDGLGKLDSTMARELVEATVHLDILNGWLRAEKRSDVRNTITKQVGLIKDLEKRAEEAMAAGV